MSSLFSLLLWMNLSNIIPFFFPVMCHLPFAMFFACFFWGVLSLSSFVNSWEQSVGMSVPLGCPLVLAPLMVMMELISCLVRPITLMVRLVFNLTAGQVILVLMSGLGAELILLHGVKFKGWVFLVSILGVVFGIGVFFLFEFAVSVLQSYIYCMLLCSYSDDHSVWFDF
uniref:ATP synthase subunit a n=1 Tax=Perna perna TaxID=94826 RepID=A0A0B4U0P6_PERPR|nr:ATP synthase F0 subunit 6 [Perna perna]AJC00163.1 ATP synthase F0 subunit 6 [Perna perna]